MCRKLLNSSIAVDAIDEMLLQHLVTERLIDVVFGRDDIAQRNVFAAELGKVMDAEPHTA